MGGATYRDANIASERADIGTLRDMEIDIPKYGDIPVTRDNRSKLRRIHFYIARHQLDYSALSRGIASFYAANLDSGVRRGKLFLGSDEAHKRLKREQLLESGARHRPELNGLAVDIVGVGADPEGDSNTIVLVMPDHVIVKPRRRPHANAEHPRRQRIERPCMTDTTLPENTANPIDHVVRAHTRGFVHPNDERKARLSPLSCHEYPFNTTRKRVIPLSRFSFHTLKSPGRKHPAKRYEPEQGLNSISSRTSLEAPARHRAARTP